MKVIDLEDKKDESKYGVNSLVEDIQRIHKDKGIEIMAVIYKSKDGRVGVGTTYGNNAEILGLMEIGKMQYLEYID